MICYSYVEIEYVATSFSPARMDLLMFAIIIFANMCARDLSRYSLLTQKTRLLAHLQKFWHKMTFNVIAATCVASNLHKQPK
jgi:hypothetical protein